MDFSNKDYKHMRLRTAKKIMLYNENSKQNMHRFRHFQKLRPPFYKNGRKLYPSWHDIDIIKRATVRLTRWIRKGTNS